MADLIFIVATIAFFGLCVAYVRGCERIVRATADLSPDELTAAKDQGRQPG